MTIPDDATGGPFTARELAERLGGELEGDGDRELTGVRGLGEAESDHLSFLANRKYVPQLETTRAGTVLLDRDTDAHGHTAIRVDDPYVAFARALALFHPQPWPEPRVDPRASIADDAVVDGATVEAFAWIGPGAVVGPGSWIEAGAYVGAGVRLGERCRLMPGSVAYAGTVLGNRVWLNPGAVVGGEGFGFAPRRGGHVKIPQTGRSVIGDDVEIGSNSSVDRATMGETVVGEGSKLDSLVQIGHGARVGDRALMAAYAAVAGSTRVGDDVTFAGKAAAINHLKIGAGSILSAQSIAMRDLPEGARVAGSPAIDHRRWLRASAAFEKLPELLTRLRELERRVAELEAESPRPPEKGD